jgi:hypothetical protein
MANGLPGADSATPVTTQFQGQSLIDLTRSHFGATPAFWGRYFSNPTTKGNVEYRGSLENAALSAAGIRLLPVARQTTRVNGSSADGAADATGNVDDLLATFSASYLVSQGGTFFIFLDVEGTPENGSPSMSLDYYTGWAQTVTSHSQAASNNQVTIRPCIYGRALDNITWGVLKTAIANGVDCGGAWSARYLNNGCTEFPDWNDAFVNSAAIPCPVLLWQYGGNCLQSGAIDCSQTNPSLDPNATLLNFLIPPPAGS